MRIHVSILAAAAFMSGSSMMGCGDAKTAAESVKDTASGAASGLVGGIKDNLSPQANGGGGNIAPNGAENIPPADTGDVALDFLLDMMNGQHTSEHGTKKYRPLAENKTECKAKVSAAFEKLINGPELQAMVKTLDGKKTLKTILQADTQMKRDRNADNYCGFLTMLR
jgi:hypothetical protein